jgi:hypothetical protein
MNHDNGGSAFCTLEHDGMTLRDYFAAKALQGVASQDFVDDDAMARWAYKMADAMLKAKAQADSEPEQKAVVAQLLEALEASHQHHIDYDDHGGYPESELFEQTTAAIARAKGQSNG